VTRQNRAAREVASFRDVPHGCHCTWTVRCTNRGARWALREVFPACPVHGRATIKPSPKEAV